MDILEWLEENDVDYKTVGKNISAGWIGMRCFFCDDTSDHLGIQIKDLRCRCWRCGGHSIVSVVQEILSCDRKAARKIAKTLKGSESELLDEQSYSLKGYEKHTTKLPHHLETFPKIYLDYLKKRKFHPNRTRRKYNLLAGGPAGDYKFRIIIPIYMNNRLVTFTSRAIFDEIEPKYKNAGIRESTIPPRDSIYNYDNIFNGLDCLVLEGPADVWRWGDGACCTIGLQFTQAQLSSLKDKNVNNLFIMLDSERFAQRVKAEEMARLMTPWVNKVELLEANWQKDLGDFLPSEAYQLRKHLNFQGSLREKIL